MTKTFLPAALACCAVLCLAACSSTVTTYPIREKSARDAIAKGGSIYNLPRADHHLVLQRERTTYLPSALLTRIVQAGRYADLAQAAGESGVVHPMLDQAFGDKVRRVGSLQGLPIEQAQMKLVYTQYALEGAKVETRFAPDPAQYYVMRYRGKQAPPHLILVGGPGKGDAEDHQPGSEPANRPTLADAYLTPAAQVGATLGHATPLGFNISTEPGKGGQEDAMGAARRIMATIADLDRQIDDARAAVVKSVVEQPKLSLLRDGELPSLRKSEALEVVPQLEKERETLLSYLFGTVAVVDDEVSIPLGRPTDSTQAAGRQITWARFAYDPATGLVASAPLPEAYPVARMATTQAGPEVELSVIMQMEAPEASLVRDVRPNTSHAINGMVYRVPANALVMVVEHHRPSGEKMMLYRGNHSMPELGFMGVVPAGQFDNKHVTYGLRRDGSLEVKPHLHISPLAAVAGGLALKKAAKKAGKATGGKAEGSKEE